MSIYHERRHISISYPLTNLVANCGEVAGGVETDRLLRENLLEMELNLIETFRWLSSFRKAGYFNADILHVLSYLSLFDPCNERIDR